MIYFYESKQDLALRGGGVLSHDDPDEWWTPVNASNIASGDIADIIDMIGKPASEQVSDTYDEYRDERDDSSRLADRHGC